MIKQIVQTCVKILMIQKCILIKFSKLTVDLNKIK